MIKEKILIVDDDEDATALLEKRLADAGYDPSASFGGATAVEMAKEIKPNLIILDVMMPNINGIVVKEELNRDALTAHIPVIFLSAKAGPEDKLNGLRVRADDYVAKPYHAEELLTRIENILERHRYYENISMKDPLTGLPNAAFLKKELAAAFKLSRESGRLFSIGVFDIDDFKSINDNYGHLIGDEVIVRVADRMNRVLRTGDFLSRYGGDEFVMIFQGNSSSQALLAAERIKKEIEKEPFSFSSKVGELIISISTGIATYDSKLLNEAELFELADQAMYRDKKSKK